MSSPSSSTRSIDFILRELFTAALGVLGIYVSTQIMKRVLDPNAEARERLRGRRDAVISRLRQAGVSSAALSGLSPAEESLLYDIVFPEDISSSFQSIGGLGGVKEAVKEIIVYPLLYPDVFRAPARAGAGASATAALLAPPKGVLLYGPPGTGKTMLAKALAKESGAIFIALSPSSLLSKWLGETEQFARAVFTLARRVQPAIVFIDEIDGLFRERNPAEHEAHKNLKSEFMQLWDGLTTDERNSQVIVLGATNRPYDVDPAILRRMPRAFEVGLPNSMERTMILKTILKGVALEKGFKFEDVAAVTGGYSGSDLKELCRAAMMQPVREAMRRARQSTMMGQSEQKDLRPLRLEDLMNARLEVTRTEDQSADYMQRERGFGGGGSTTEVDVESVMQFLRKVSSSPNGRRSGDDDNSNTR